MPPKHNTDTAELRPQPTLGQTDSNLAVKNLGIIVNRVHVHWLRLPAVVRSFYDLEDMVSDVVLHVLRAASKFDPARSRESTFVWWAANSRCLAICHPYCTRVLPEMISLESLSHITEAAPESAARLRMAIEGVERVLQDAVRSPSWLGERLTALLSGNFTSGWPEEERAELRRLARKHSVSFSDFRLVLHFAVA